MPTTRAALHASRPVAFFAKADSGLYALNLETGRHLWSAQGRFRVLALIVPEAGDRLITTTEDGRILTWDVDTGAQLDEAWLSRPPSWLAKVGRILTGGGEPSWLARPRPSHLALSPDQSLLVVNCEHWISVRDARTLEPIRDFRGTEHWPYPSAGIVVASDGKPRLVIARESLRIYDPITGAVLLDRPLPNTASGLAVAPDRATFCVCDFSGRICLFDTTGHQVRVIHDADPNTQLEHPVFSPDGTRLAVSDNSNVAIRIFDPKRGVELLSLYDHKAWCHDLFFGPRGVGLFVTTNFIHTHVRVWQAPPDVSLGRR